MANQRLITLGLYIFTGSCWGFWRGRHHPLHSNHRATENWGLNRLPEPPVVVVIGSGLAGLTAALSAGRAGARVILADKAISGHGNSNLAITGLSVARDLADREAFFEDIMVSSGSCGKEDLARKLAYESQSALELLESLGLSFPRVALLGGHSRPRTFCPQDLKETPLGPYLTHGVLSAVKQELGASLEVRRGLKFVGVEFSQETNAVTSVSVSDRHGNCHTVDCDALVLAAGGFAASLRALQKFCPAGGFDRGNWSTSNGPQATGEALEAALAAGARSVDLDKVQIYPQGFVEFAKEDVTDKTAQATIQLKHTGKYIRQENQPEVGRQMLHTVLCPEEWRGAGAVLLDPSTGKRFVDELATRDAVAEAIAARATGDAWLMVPPAVLGAENSGASGTGLEAGSWYEGRNLVRRVSTREEDGGVNALAKALGVPEEALRSEISEYDRLYESPEPDIRCQKTGKETFPVKLGLVGGGPWVVARVRPVVHYCMGGVAIDDKARVLKAEPTKKGHGEVIPGLYACGEITGGVHGKNRLGGTSLTECVVFGTEAGRGAASWARQQGRQQ